MLHRELWSLQAYKPIYLPTHLLLQRCLHMHISLSLSLSLSHTHTHTRYELPWNISFPLLINEHTMTFDRCVDMCVRYGKGGAA